MIAKLMRAAGGVCLCGVVGLTACENKQTTATTESADVSMGVVNDTCPCGDSHVTGATAEYEGHSIGFCCAECAAHWNTMSDAERQAFIENEVAERESAAAGAVNLGIINATCPIMGGKVNAAVEPAEYKGHKVGFCCGGCIDDWAALSDAQKDEFVNSVHEADGASPGAVGGMKEGACEGTNPCCSETGEVQNPSPPPVSPGAIGGETKEGACTGGGCSETKQTDQIHY